MAPECFSWALIPAKNGHRYCTNYFRSASLYNDAELSDIVISCNGFLSPVSCDSCNIKVYGQY